MTLCSLGMIFAQEKDLLCVMADEHEWTDGLQRPNNLRWWAWSRKRASLCQRNHPLRGQLKDPPNSAHAAVYHKVFQQKVILHSFQELCFEAKGSKREALSSVGAAPQQLWVNLVWKPAGIHNNLTDGDWRYSICTAVCWDFPFVINIIHYNIIQAVHFLTARNQSYF